MEVHRPFPLAGGARGEGDERDVVGGGRDVGERHRLPRHQRLDRPGGVDIGCHVVLDDPSPLTRAAIVMVRHRHRTVGGQARVGDGERDACLVGDEDELAGPAERDGADHDAAGLEDRKPERGHHWRVGATQEDTVSRNETEVVHQHVGDLVGPGQQVGVAPRDAGGTEAGATAPSARDRPIQQLGGAVQPVGIVQLRDAGIIHRRPQVARGEGIVREVVDVCGGHTAWEAARRGLAHAWPSRAWCGDCPSWLADSSTCPAMTSFWISLVPS